VDSSPRIIVSIVAVAAIAIAFWMLALGPKREEASELGQQVKQLNTAIEQDQSEVAAATAAQHSFPADYRQLVTLGQAVPVSDETSSLLVELDQIAAESKVKFDSIQLDGSSESSSAPVPAPAPAPAAPAAPSAGSSSAVPAAATVPPTEVAASLLPLGASIGSAGLAVMPYSLSFRGSFFNIADFIKRIDSLVKPGASTVAVDGRLVTINSFSLGPDPEQGFPYLDASLSVTTYLTPPSQGVTAGATPTAPAPSTATPAASEAPAAGTPASSSSQTVSAR
jgi:Tfp pilus assembly protein PilO